MAGPATDALAAAALPTVPPRRVRPGAAQELNRLEKRRAGTALLGDLLDPAPVACAVELRLPGRPVPGDQLGLGPGHRLPGADHPYRAVPGVRQADQVAACDAGAGPADQVAAGEAQGGPGDAPERDDGAVPPGEGQ